MILRGLTVLKHFRAISKFQYSKSLSSTCHPKEDSNLTKIYEDILSRTKVVTCENESAEIVRNIIKKGDPVAVDVEGIHLKILGLVQIKTSDDRIYLLRTGRNRKLLFEGGLKDLFEDCNILKVMHGAVGDLRAIYREGIRLWGFFDTDRGHKVIQYQNFGATTVETPTGFQTVCKAYGMMGNPLKGLTVSPPSQRDNVYLDWDELPQDRILYSAFDVEPLLDIHQIMMSIIMPDFVPLLNDLLETDLIRCVDPDLYKNRCYFRKRDEANSLFIQNIDYKVSKADIYELLAPYDGNKKVLMSPVHKTIHIVMSNRQNAVLAFKAISEKKLLEQRFGQKALIRLLNSLRLSEVEAADMEAEKSRDKLIEENYIVDSGKALKLLKILERVKCPIVLNLVTVENGVSLEMFVGKFPVLKFDVNPETIAYFGIGEIIASKEITKIIARTDSESGYIFFRTCSARNFRPSNFFDVSSAARVNDYLHYGTSIYKSPIPNAKEAASRNGIFASTHHERLLYVYLHLKSFLPIEMLNVLGAKSRVDLDMAANIFVEEAKEARRQLRIKCETLSLHVRAKQRTHPKFKGVKLESMLKESLQRFLKLRQIEFSNLIVFSDRAIITLVHHQDVLPLVEEINSAETLYDTFDVTATRIDQKTCDREIAKTVNVLDLNRQNLPHIDNLTQLGFFQVLDENKPLPPQKKQLFVDLNSLKDLS